MKKTKRKYVQRPVPKGYMDIKMIVRETGLSFSLVYRMIKKSGVPVSEIGRTVIKRSDFRKVFLRPIPRNQSKDKAESEG